MTDKLERDMDISELWSGTDTSDTACAMICMLVSNPGGVMRTDGDGWQRRVNDLIRALRDERNVLRGKIDKIAEVLA